MEVLVVLSLFEVGVVSGAIVEVADVDTDDIVIFLSSNSIKH